MLSRHVNILTHVSSLYTLLNIQRFAWRILLLTALCLWHTNAEASEVKVEVGLTLKEGQQEVIDETKCMDFTIYFVVNQTEINDRYMGNASRLKQMTHYIDSIISRPGVQVHEIKLCGYSSPEGPESYNNKLSKKRMECIKNYLVAHTSLDAAKFRTSYVTENWDDLAEAIRASTLPHRQAMLDIINSKLSADQKEARIRARYPIEYSRLKRQVYPKLRYTKMDIVYTEKKEEEPQPQQPVIEPAPVDTTPPVAEVPIPTPMEPIDTTAEEIPAAADTITYDCLEGLRPILAIKTNMLYDLLLSPNLEIERWLGKRHQWSVMAEWMAPWYVWHHNRRAYEILNIGVEGRYWFNANRKCPRWLCGWFVGAYVMSGKYDLEWNGKGYQGEHFSPGLTLGFAHRIGRKWNLEYSLSGGWLTTDYRYYEAMFNDKHLIWQHNGHTTYWGLTKAKISLVYFLDENWLKSLFHSKKKGGLL